MQLVKQLIETDLQGKFRAEITRVLGEFEPVSDPFAAGNGREHHRHESVLVASVGTVVHVQPAHRSVVTFHRLTRGLTGAVGGEEVVDHIRTRCDVNSI